MTNRAAMFPPSTRLFAGIIVILVTAVATYGQWRAQRDPLDALAWIETHRGPQDTAMYTHAQRHVAYIRDMYGDRWSPTGYATLGVVGTLIGVVLLASSRDWRAP